MEAQKNYKMQGLFGSVIVHLVILLLLFFMILSVPNPPLDDLVAGGGGLELNYGTEDQGFGEQQSTAPAGQVATAEPTTPETPTPDPSPQTTPVTDNAQNVITSDEPGNDINLKEEKKKQEEAANQKRIAEEKERQKRKLNSAASYPTASNSNSDNNNGNDPGKTGDKGQKDGTPKGPGYYPDGGGPGKGPGNGPGEGPGTGPGASLDMAGWQWDSTPKLTGNTKESGRIRFKIKIDADGEIETIKVEEKTVSQSLVNFYEAELRRQLRFSKSNGKGATEGATGFITLIIR